MLRKLTHVSPYLVAAGALLLVFAVALWRFLFGVAWPIWDADRLFAPAYLLIADLVRQGQLLWWNPWGNAGQPDFADIQYGAHNPLVLLLAWLCGDSVGGFVAYWFVLWLLFGAGMLALARQWRVPAWGGFVVAASLTFSGFFVGHAEHTPVVYSWVFMPLVLWRLDVALTESRSAAAVQAGLLFGLSVAGGYPAVFLTNAVFLACWIGARMLAADDRRSAVTVRRGEALRAGAILVAVTALVALPGLLNFMHEGRGFTDRVGVISREVAVSSNALHPRALVTLASPYLATLPSRLLWDYTDISSCSLYAGGLVFVFAFYALLVRPRSRLRWALVAGALFAVLAALSRVLPLREWLYDWVPLTRYFRHPSWFRAYPIFILGLLALLGMRDFHERGPEPPSWWRLVLAALASAAAAIVAYVAIVVHVRDGRLLAGSVHLGIAWLLPALVVCWLRRIVFWRRPAWLALVFGVIAAADVVLNAELSTTLGSRDKATGAEWASVQRRRRHSTDLLALDGAARTFKPMGSYNNKHLLTRQAGLFGVTALTNTWHSAAVSEPVLVAAATTADRFWFTAEPVRSPPSGAAFVTFLARAKAMGAPPLVLHTRDAMLGPPPPVAEDAAGAARIQQAGPAQKAVVKLERYRPESLSLVFQAPSDGWLLVTDRWSRGWTASVDDRPVAVEGANFVFRALRVHQGVNHVSMAYRPLGYPWLPPVSWLLVLAVAVLGAWPALRHLRSRFARA